MNPRLTLEEAREILRRAVEKSLEVGWISSYAVVDEGGNVISISRVDGAPPSAAASARAKAYLAAVTGRKTLPFAERMDAHPVRFTGWQRVLGRPMFPGPGAMPIVKDGRVVGGFSSNVSSAPGGMQILLDGRKQSRADIVTAYALQIPYDEQHADVP
jgi:uncharacterized protein GlcG (DUF336 family)